MCPHFQTKTEATAITTIRKKTYDTASAKFLKHLYKPVGMLRTQGTCCQRGTKQWSMSPRCPLAFLRNRPHYKEIDQSSGLTKMLGNPVNKLNCKMG